MFADFALPYVSAPTLVCRVQQTLPTDDAPAPLKTAGATVAVDRSAQLEEPTVANVINGRSVYHCGAASQDGIQRASAEQERAATEKANRETTELETEQREQA